MVDKKNGSAEEDSFNDHEEFADGEGEGWRAKVMPELVKRLFVSGLGALLTSEEGIRRLAADFKLPKDVATYLISQAQTTKNELFRIVAREIRDFLENINLGQEITKVLTSLTFEIKMQVRLLPSDNGDTVRPDVKGKVKVIKNGDAETASDD